MMVVWVTVVGGCLVGDGGLVGAGALVCLGWFGLQVVVGALICLGWFGLQVVAGALVGALVGCGAGALARGWLACKVI